MELAWLEFALLNILGILNALQNYFRSVLLALKLPGPAALPFFGNALVIRNPKPLELCDEIIKRHNRGGLIRTWIFCMPVILVIEPEHLRVILSNTKLSDKNFFYTIMHTFIGDGLITNTGDKWKRNRRLIQPYFQVNFLQAYLEDFAQVAREVVKALKGRRCVEMTKIINTCVLKVLHKSVLGVDLATEYDTPFRRSELFLTERLLRPWLLLDSIFRHSDMARDESRHSTELHYYVKKILAERMAERRVRKLENCCLLDRFIDISESTGGFSEEDVLNETVTFLLAGHDSVSSAVVFSLYFLAKHQNVQEKVYKELSEVTLDKTNELRYMEQCIKETLRLVPSIPVLGRVLSCDVTLGGHTVPAGTNIWISPLITHRLPHVFREPEKFDPERFSLEHSKEIQPYGYLPFSMGPRNCIGYKFAYLEIKTILASIVQNYHLRLKPGGQDLSLGYKVTLRARGGVWLMLEPRTAQV